jgi:YidC/Oxa1 family membrane protein insertase
MKNDFNNKNFLLAMVLSMAILLAWQFGMGYFYPPKPVTPQQQTTAAPGTNAGSNASAPGAMAAGAITREEALKGAARVLIDTPEVKGSISLKGAQIDDLHLNKYREAISPSSPTITLLTPAGAPNAYFVEHGLINPAGGTLKVPDANTVWTAPAGATLGINKPVTLTWDNGEGLQFARQISVDEQYVFSITQSIVNNSKTSVSLLPYGLIARQDTPHIAGYYVFYEGMLGWLDGKLQEINYSDVQGEAEPTTVESSDGWLGFTDQYWATAMIPDQSKPIKTRFRHTLVGGRDLYQTDYVARDAIVVPPGATGVYQDQLFAGPKVVQLMKDIGEKYKIANFDMMIDWGWFGPFTRFMFWLLDSINKMVGNFGLAILVTTVLVKLAVFPLANKSYASMSKMKKLAPEMAKLKELYPDDKMKQQQAMMEMYKREKVSPASGCLPVLVQIPIFFSLYKVILTSIELRHAPFYGWIHDLSAADPTNMFTLFGLIPWSPPSMLQLGIWPLLMGITMWVQMRLNPTPPDPVQASMFNWMPVLFTFMLGSFPVGLVIYWAWSNLLGIIQQGYIMKKHGTEIDLLGNIRDSLPFLKKKTEAG